MMNTGRTEPIHLCSCLFCGLNSAFLIDFLQFCSFTICLRTVFWENGTDFRAKESRERRKMKGIHRNLAEKHHAYTPFSLTIFLTFILL